MRNAPRFDNVQVQFRLKQIISADAEHKEVRTATGFAELGIILSLLSVV